MSHIPSRRSFFVGLAAVAAASSLSTFALPRALLATGNAAAIQAQIDAAAAAGGGDVVLPAGRQVLTSQVVIKAGVRLIGSGKTGFNYHLAGAQGGTILDIQWGSGPGSCGDVTKAAIVPQGSTSLINVGFDYSLQDVNAAVPIEYGSTVQPNDPERNEYQVTVQDCYFYRSYLCMDFCASKGGHGLSNLIVTGCTGAPIYCALAIDGVTDWQVISNCNFNSGFLSVGSKTGLVAWASNNGRGLIIGGNDWLQMIGVQLFGFAIGAEIDGGVGYAGSGPYTFQNCQFDGCWHGIEINGAILHPIRVFDSTFAPYNFITGSQGCALNNNPGATVKGLQFSNNYMFGPALFMVYLASGTISDILITGNVARVAGSGGPAVYVQNGHNVQITGNILENFAVPFNTAGSTGVITANNQT